MLRLIFEAVMIIAIASALFFMMKIGKQEDLGERVIPDENDEDKVD